MCRGNCDPHKTQQRTLRGPNDSLRENAGVEVGGRRASVGHLDDNKQNQSLAEGQDVPLCWGCVPHASLSDRRTLDSHPGFISQEPNVRFAQLKSFG